MATTTLTVRVGRELAEFIDRQTGENGTYENVSEYIRDLIRRDRERASEFERLRDHLQWAFAQPDESFVESSPEKIFATFQPAS